MLDDTNTNKNATVLGNLENQIDLDNITVKTEEEDEEEGGIIRHNFPNFSYTLDLSFHHKPRDELSYGTHERVTQFVKPSLKYVKLKDDNSIETNSETPWALAKKVFPRSLERILANCGVKSTNKKRNVNLSLFNNNKQVCRGEVNILSEESTYSNFMNHKDKICNSSMVSELYTKEYPTSSCRGNEVIVLEGTDRNFEPLHKKIKFSKAAFRKEPSEINIDEESLSQNRENAVLGDEVERKQISSEQTRTNNQVVNPKKPFSSSVRSDMKYENNIGIENYNAQNIKKKTKHKKLVESIANNNQIESISLAEDLIDNLQNSCNEVLLDNKTMDQKTKQKISAAEIKERINPKFSLKNSDFVEIKKCEELPEEHLLRKQIRLKEFGENIIEKENITRKKKKKKKSELENNIKIAQNEFIHFSEDQATVDSFQIGCAGTIPYDEKNKQWNKQKISVKGVDKQVNHKLSQVNTDFKITEKQTFIEKENDTKFTNFAENGNETEISKGSKKKKKYKPLEETITDIPQSDLISTKNDNNVLQNNCMMNSYTNENIKQQKKKKILAQEEDKVIELCSGGNAEFELSEQYGLKKEKSSKKKKKNKELEESILDIDITGFGLSKDHIGYDNQQIYYNERYFTDEQIKQQQKSHESGDFELLEDHISKKKKKSKLNEFEKGFENISIHQNIIDKEDTTSVDYRKRKKRNTAHVYTKNEEKIREDEEKFGDNIKENEYIYRENKKKKKYKELNNSISNVDHSKFMLTGGNLDLENPQTDYNESLNIVEKIKQKDEHKIDIFELPVEHIKKKKKKIRLKEFENCIQNNIPIADENIEEENCINVDYRKKKTKNAYPTHTKNEEKIRDNEGEYAENIEVNAYITKESKKKKKHRELKISISDIDQKEFVLTEGQIDLDNSHIVCNEFNHKGEKIKQQKKQKVGFSELTEEHVKENKKKKIKKFETNFDDNIPIVQNSIGDEIGSNVAYRKKKEKNISKAHLRNEQKLSENDERKTLIVNSGNEQNLSASYHKYAVIESSNIENAPSENKIKRKKRSKSVPNGEVKTKVYKDVDYHTTEIVTENSMDSVSVKKYKKIKKKSGVASTDIQTCQSGFEKHIFHEDNKNKETENLVSKVRKEQFGKFIEDKQESFISNEIGNKIKIKQKVKNTQINEENIDIAITKYQDNTENNGQAEERRESKKKKNKKNYIGQSPQVHESEEISSEKYENRNNLIDDVLNFINDETTDVTVETGKHNEKKTINLDKRISDILSAKVESLFETSGFDQWSSDKNKLNKKGSNMKIVDSTLNININTDFEKRKRSKDQLNSTEDEMHNRKRKKGVKINEESLKISDKKISEKFSTTDEDIDMLKFGKGKKLNNERTLEMNDGTDKNSKNKLKEISSNMNITLADIEQNTINRLENESIHSVDSDSDFQHKISEDKSITSPYQQKYVIFPNDTANLFNTEKQKEKKGDIWNKEIENVFHNTTKLSDQKFKSMRTDIPSIDLVELTSNSKKSVKTSTAQDIKNEEEDLENNSGEEDHENNSEYQDEDYEADDADPLVGSEKQPSHEIFIENNSIPTNEIDLFDSDVQSEFEDNEKIRNLHNHLSQRIKKTEYFENKNVKKETNKRNSSEPEIEIYKTFQSETSKRKFTDSEDYQVPECDINTNSNIDNISEKKVRNKRKVHKEPTKHKPVDNNLKIEKTEDIDDDEDIFTGIFRSEFNEKRSTESDAKKDFTSGKEIDNLKNISLDKSSILENSIHSQYIKDSPNQLSENFDFKRCKNSPQKSSENEVTNGFNKSFSFADILSQSHSNTLMQKYNDIVNESNSKKMSPEVTVTEAYDPSVKQEYSPCRSASLKELTKSQTKQLTIDNFVEKTIHSEEKKKKQKVIELLKQSKSIQEIEEELEIPNVDEEREAVQDLFIETPWPTAPIHSIAYLVSGNPTLWQKKALKNAGISYKLGKYTKEEDEKIKQNWLEFCKYHDWDEDNYLPFLKASAKSGTGVLHKYQRQKFAQFISHGFEHRLMYSVYQRFQRIFSQKEMENGRFTEEDDKIIKEYVGTEKSDKPYADLAKILKRSRLAILKRYKIIQSRNSTNCDKVIWTKELTECLLANMMEVTCSANLSELKNRHIATQEWEKISKNMNIPIEKLKRAWIYCFHPRFFTSNYSKELSLIKKELVDLLYVKYNDWREINWQEVAKEFDNGFTNAKLCKVMRDLLTSKVPPKMRNNLHNALKYLRKHYHEEERKTSDRFEFVKEILKETKNGTILPKISKKEVPSSRTKGTQSSERLDESFSD